MFGILLTLFFGGAAFVYGGYALDHRHRIWAVFSYAFGVACMVAAIMLAVIRSTSSPSSLPFQQVVGAPIVAAGAPKAIPIPSSVERAAPIPSSAATGIFAPVTSTLIKPQDQADLGDAIAKRAQSMNLHCRALILRCPSVGCEDDSRALTAVLARAGWAMPWEPTSHGWTRLKSRLVIHSKVDDTCAAVLANTLYDFGIDRTDVEDANMRKLDYFEIVIQNGK